MGDTGGMFTVSPSVIFAAQVGLGLAAAQLLLTALCASPLGGFARRQPAFVAHQIITLPLMAYIACLGCSGWFFPTPEASALASTIEGRLYGRDDVGAKLASIVMGAMIFWDIPCTCVPSIYSAAGMGHHVGLAVLSSIALLPYLTHYCPFFVGVIELSSIPLVIVDFFHPKHFADVAASHPVLGAINEALRLLFATSFLALRTLAFPFVIFTAAIPDFATQLDFEAGGSKTTLAACGIFFALSFTVLQLHWSWLLVQQVLKGLRKGAKGPKDSDGSGVESYKLYEETDDDDAESGAMLKK